MGGNVQTNVPIVVDPIAKLSAAFTSITETMEAHKTYKGNLLSANEAQARAADALATATSRTTEVKSTVATQVENVVLALDAASAALVEVKGLFAE